MRIEPAFTEEQMGGHRHFVTGIDGLRALAVIGVIVYHLLPSVMRGGYLGVPLFLLISGYFVTDQLLHRWDTFGNLDVGNFYIRRIKRLYPTLLTMLVATSAYITVFARPLLHQLRAIFLTNVLGVYNWWEILHGQSYFDRFAAQSPFTHMWTMGVEIQFYLLWPIILWLLLRFFKHRSTVQSIVLVLAILSAVEMAVLYNPANVNRVYYGTDTRAFSLMLGSWLAFVWPRRRLRANLDRSGALTLDVIGIIGLGLTIVSFFLMSGVAASTYRGGMFLMSLIGMLLLATIVHPGAQMNSWLTNPLFAWLGRRSYGIYVYQFPVMVFYEQRIPIGNHPYLNAVVEIIIILLISDVSYRFIERPLTHFYWTNLWIVLRGWVTNMSGHWKEWATTIPCIVLIATAGIGLASPERAPKANAVQKRIQRSHKQAAAHNKAVAEGKVPVVNTSSNSVKKKYDLSTSQLRRAGQLKVTAIGDSVMDDASGSLQEVMPHSYVDAKVSRQGSEAPDVINHLKADHHLQKIVVVNLGTNGAMTTQTVQQILDAIGPDHQIYWVNAHIPTKDWQAAVNKQILQVAKQRKDVYLVDWYGLSKQHPEWFASDGVHMNDKGNAQFTRLIVTTILKHN